MQTSRLALIDGDIIVYKMAYRMDKPREVEATFASTISKSVETPRTEQEVKEAVDEFLLNVVQKLGTKHLAGFLSDKRKNLFRTKLATIAEYKGNRKGERPQFYNFIRSYLEEEYGFLTVHEMEADDALASCQNSVEGYSTFICTTDKDMMQVPGFHYNWDKDEIVEMRKETAFKFLCIQALTGDSTDNIKGIPKVGPKTAEKWLKDVPNDEMLPIVLYHYIEKFGVLEGVHNFQENFKLVALKTDLEIFPHVVELPKKVEINVEENQTGW